MSSPAGSLRLGRAQGADRFFLLDRPISGGDVVQMCASGGWITPAGFEPDVRSPRVAVDIPADYTRMLSEDPSLALRWRLETRAIFAQYLDAGYRVVDFAEDEARTRGRYLLTTIRPDP